MKLNKNSIVAIIAAVLALAAVVVGYISNVVNPDNAVKEELMMILCGVLAVALSAIPVVMGKNPIVALVAPAGAIALNMCVLSYLVCERVLTIAGLFSYASNNPAGWNMFYCVIGAAVCIVLSCLANMVVAFGKNEQ